MKRKQYTYRVRKNERYWHLWNAAMRGDWDAWKAFQRLHVCFRDYRLIHTKYHKGAKRNQSVVSLSWGARLSRPDFKRFVAAWNENETNSWFEARWIHPEVPVFPKQVGKGRKALFRAIVAMDIFADNCEDSIYCVVLDRLEGMIKEFMRSERRASRKDLTLRDWANFHNLLNAYNLGV